MVDGQSRFIEQGYGKSILLKNRDLREVIANDHLLLSEYPPHPARKHRFPMRNRIIAALSKGTCVFEAKKKKRLSDNSTASIGSWKNSFFCSRKYIIC